MGSNGWRIIDEFELPYTFEVPSSWVARDNSLRPGIYVSDFQTADKASTEHFESRDWASRDEFIMESIRRLLLPSQASSGDSKLELPPLRSVKGIREIQIDGASYTYFTFLSTTTTRSGYDVQRANSCVVACKKGSCYVLGVSVRGDQNSKAKKADVQRIVEGFRLR